MEVLTRHSSTIMALLVLGIVACRGEREPAPETEAAAVATPGADAEPATITVTGFDTPESVLHDTAADVYLVSNINGDPGAKDSNGYISRVSPDGDVLERRWIDGAAAGVELHAPKGMAIVGDTLFVTDIDVVRLFDRATGERLATWPVSGATFLNDLAVSPEGVLFVSDTGIRITAEGISPTGTDAIYRFTANGTPEPVLEEGVTAVNGLAVWNERLYAVAFNTGAIFAIDEEGVREDYPPLPGADLDGIEVLPDGGMLISDWETGGVYLSDANGVAELILEAESPADIGYDAARNRVLVPGFTTNVVLIHSLPAKD